MKGIGVVVAGLPRKMRQSGCEMHGSSPVPLAISSTTPRAGKIRFSTARIGSRLRATAMEHAPLLGKPSILRSCL